MPSLRPSSVRLPKLSVESFRHFAGSGFVRHIVTLATGAALAQVIP